MEICIDQRKTDIISTNARGEIICFIIIFHFKLYNELEKPLQTITSFYISIVSAFLSGQVDVNRENKIDKSHDYTYTKF